MDLPYRRLYVRMALYVGAALAAFVAIGAAIFVVIASYELQGYIATRHSALGQDAATVLARGGRPALERWLRSEAAVPPDAAVYVLDEQGRDVLGRPLPGQYASFVGRLVAGGAERRGDNYLPTRLIPQLVAPDGQLYSFLILPSRIGLWGSPALVAGLIAVALLVIATVAWLIARTFGRPIGELQFATRQLASGHIEARVPAAISRRHDELGALATDFNTMAEKLSALLASREQLMRELSHELRSPLARLQAALSLAAQRRTLEPAEQERIEREVRQMDRAIGEILRFSRLDSAATIARRLLRLDELLAELVRVEEVEASARGCRIELRAEPGLALIGDPELLRSGLENIVRNAIRYAPPGSAVEIATRREGAGLRVMIADRGPGVPAEHVERIFEPYFRVPNRPRDPHGTGLGLAIARRAIEAHGGRVAAAPRDGGGLIVTVDLPAADLT
jgi:two-component system sensor histidine kinase CpxA